MNAIKLLQYVVFFCWTVFSIFVILEIMGQFYRPQRGKKKAENVECVLVSVANYKVKKSLLECIAYTKEKLDNHLWLLVDEGSESIPQFQENSLVIVPASYRKDLIGKGRAINYFIEKEVQPDKWYAFIDDDHLILDDSFLYEIPYYEERGYVAMNPVLFPRKGKSTLTYIMDFIRYFNDLTMFRFFTGFLKQPLAGLHGELLTVKGKVLKEIGYGNPSIVEDFRFASELVRRGYKTWQSNTKVSIKSPNSIGDLIKQRGRWFKGIAMEWKYCPLLMKEITGLKLLIWVLGIFGSWAMVPLWFFWKPLWFFWEPAFWFSFPGSLYYWVIYLYGVMMSKKPYYFFLIPLFGIFESISAYAGLRQKGFVVIDKN
ncbi:glycosyltransferase [Candidatus Infernicultor aquiphilus]